VDFHIAVLLNVHGESEAANLLLSSLLLRGRHSEDLQVALGLCLLRVPLLPSQVDPSKDAVVHDAGSLAAVIAHKQYEAAEAGFRGFLAKYPGTAFVHYAWGTMLAKEGKDDAAEAQLEGETKLNPNSALAYSEWAFLALKASRYDRAASLARKAIQLSKNSFTAHYVLGSALLATGQTEASVAELEQARNMVPESPEIRYGLSRAYAKLGKNELAKQEAAEFARLKAKPASGQETGSQNPAAQAETGAVHRESSPQRP
jgi:predicted Zn-dependent protease